MIHLQHVLTTQQPQQQQIHVMTTTIATTTSTATRKYHHSALQHTTQRCVADSAPGTPCSRMDSSWTRHNQLPHSRGVSNGIDIAPENPLRRHLQNRKYIAYRNAARGRVSQRPQVTCTENFCEVWSSGVCEEILSGIQTCLSQYTAAHNTQITTIIYYSSKGVLTLGHKGRNVRWLRTAN